MAKEESQQELQTKAQKQKIVEEKKNLKKEQKEQKKEAKKRAREIAKQEDALAEQEEGNTLVTFGATLLIVVLWLAVICVIIKMDIGGFGSNIMTPILKDIPVVNKILPGVSMSVTSNPEEYGGYTNLKDAVDQIKKLELQIDNLQVSINTKDEEAKTLKAEIIRLQEFEKKQVEFQRIRTEFYEEVVYADKGPGAEEYAKYYETMDPAMAEYIYKQVVASVQATKEIQDYASAYSQIKPKEAAGIFEKMTDDLNLVAKILNAMNADSRGKILGAMDPTVAAKLTKIMDPER